MPYQGCSMEKACVSAGFFGTNEGVVIGVLRAV